MLKHATDEGTTLEIVRASEATGRCPPDRRVGSLVDVALLRLPPLLGRERASRRRYAPSRRSPPSCRVSPIRSRPPARHDHGTTL